MVEQMARSIDSSKLKPGKRVDRLIAEKVLGIKVKKNGVPPEFSRVLTTALPLARVMRKHGFLLVLEDLSMEGHEDWQASFSGQHFCFSENPAFAICVAALKAVGAIE